MSLSVAQVYSVRFGVKLPLPQIVQDNIAKLRITAAAYRPVRHTSKHHHKHHKHDSTGENWRIKSLAGYVSRIKDNEDPDYHSMFAIFNKLSVSTLERLSEEASVILGKRDEEFRLRVSTLLFDKAIRESMFAAVMADCVVNLTKKHPELRDDLIVQAKMFHKLYDINDTLTYPSASEPGYDDKVVEWMKQKDKRRGYAKFLSQLFIRDLITEEIMVKSVEQVISELKIVSKQPKSEQTEENANQFVDFLFESSKILPTSAITLRSIIKVSLADFLAIPRPDLPSLGMRSRFRLEDTLKCVQ